MLGSFLYSPEGGSRLEKSPGSSFFLKHVNLLRNASNLPGCFTCYGFYNSALFASSFCSCFFWSVGGFSIGFGSLVELFKLLVVYYYTGGLSYYTFGFCSSLFWLTLRVYYSYFYKVSSIYSFYYFWPLVSSLVTSSQGGGKFFLSSNISFNKSTGYSTVLNLYLSRLGWASSSFGTD